jgi:osmoprotectant transport system substrate-binding protein
VKGVSVGGACASAFLFLLVACGGDATSAASGVVRVGSEQFSESQLLGEIYAQALEAGGVPVERRFGIGSRETYYPALQDGTIDLVPEYSGNLLLYVRPDATQSASQDVYDAVQAALPPDLTVLNRAEAQNKDAFTVTRATAEKYRATSIEDIASHCGELTFGGPAQFQDRAYGLAGLARNYGCTFKDFRPLDTGGPITVAALREDDIQGADLFTTDPAVPANDFVTLADPRNNFPAQNVVPLMTRAKATGVVAAALNGVSAKLSQKELLNLDVEQARTNIPDARIASAWLKAQGLA